MPKKMLIDATHAEETRVVVVDGNKVEEFDFESENKRQLAGNIYLAKVTRVEPSLQATFVDYGGNRHGFLAFSEIHPDYYQIPVADREALMAEEKAYAESLKAQDDEDEKPAPKRRRRSRSKTKAEDVKSDDAIETKDVSGENDRISGMETIDLGDDVEGSSPMELVSETPVETPLSSEDDAEDVQSGDTTSEQVQDDQNDEDDQPDVKDASEKDDSIESVADDDDVEDMRPVRKPRPRRYKIQEVVKVRQVLLVQVVKEERGNKGAALTTYLSLAGRYCVLMPNTARGGGISRKITNAVDRKKLKEIANEIDVPDGAGLIVRTAGAKRTKSEIKRDYEYLQRLWEQIRELTLKSTAPAKIYEEGNLIKRSIRDLYNREIDEVLVEGDLGYRTAKDFMKMIMPSHAKNVKPYAEALPLFARFQVESYLAAMFNPTVQLKSGGYIVIGVTEALVAIDVNSGRATKEGSIEETALKTNLEAAEEVARQLRLRDLAGLIVIDFIDMDERKNNASVEKRMKDKLKTDRARIQVGRISGFGLMEMSRQRLRPGMIEATTQPCPSCHGTGLIRSADSLGLSILRQLEEEGVRGRSKEVLVKCPVLIANFLMNQKREHIAQIEGRYGLSVRVEGDPHLISPDFEIEKFKTATRSVAVAATNVVSVDASLMADIDDAVEEGEDDAVVAVAEQTAEEDAPQPKKRRRRRRRRRGNNGESQSSDTEQGNTDAVQADQEAQKPAAEPVEVSDASDVKDVAVTEPDALVAVEEEKPKKPRARGRPRKKPEPEVKAEVSADPSTEAASEEEAKPVRKTATRRRKTAEKPVDAEDKPAKTVKKAEPLELTPEDAAPAKPARGRKKTPTELASQPGKEPENVEAAIAEVVAAATPEPAEASAEQPKAEDPSKPKRRGWWSLGR
ncbi:Rne/Rng family ribonuclease [Parasulfitobacter algicola]|uniref:Ribonuclease E n=1 Tax=Parasulfitobacter algicola TaxID=2614809 RepID=A0ABX2IYV2_9RHOB|nr:Rne/Rng family ribonuclease [Sulfitobacter algicola]NSX55836.1 Rne/Rng family ribonuclease [Sulfitobacter algicola]